MAEPSFALQKAVYEALIAANISGVTSKVYHRVPPTAALPYIEIGHDTIVGDDDAGDYFDCYVEVQAFAGSMAILKPIVAAIYQALFLDLDLEGFTTHEFHHEGTRYQTEQASNEQIENAIIEFHYKVQVAD